MIVTVLKNRASASARALQQGLSETLGTRIGAGTASSSKRTRGSRYIVNWGSSIAPEGWRQREAVFSNSCGAVANCQDKRVTLAKLDEADVPCVEWVGGSDENVNVPLEDWMETDHKLVARHTATGHSGAGIQIVRSAEQVPDAPLYTRYFRKHAEYRVHVAFGNVILIQQKRRRNGEEYNDEAGLVRTVANGWTFTINNLACDTRNYRDDIVRLGVDAANAVGAQHCAVDILSNHDTGRNVVVEINSMPGLTATASLNAYVEAFSSQIRTML